MEASSELPAIRRLPLGLILILCLLPWLWTWLGLYVFEDYRITVALYDLLACCAPFWALQIGMPDFRRPTYRFWLISIGLSILCFSLIMVATSWLGSDVIDVQQFPKTLAQVKLDPRHHFLPFALYFVTINPLVEELFWRSLIFRAFQQHFSLPKALLISSFFFGAWHFVVVSYFFPLPWSILITLMVMSGGVLFGWSYHQSKSLVPAILIHGLGADLAIVVWAYQLYKLVNLLP